VTNLRLLQLRRWDRSLRRSMRFNCLKQRQALSRESARQCGCKCDPASSDPAQLQGAAECAEPDGSPTALSADFGQNCVASTTRKATPIARHAELRRIRQAQRAALHHELHLHIQYQPTNSWLSRLATQAIAAVTPWFHPLNEPGIATASNPIG